MPILHEKASKSKLLAYMSNLRTPIPDEKASRSMNSTLHEFLGNANPLERLPDQKRA